VKTEDSFVGELKGLLHDFVEHKRNTGYKYETNSGNLRRFSEFSLKYNLKTQTLPKQLVLDWTGKRKNESDKTREHRLSNLRQFALYMQHRGYEAFIPPRNHQVRLRAFTPYIFTYDEIGRFFKICDSISPHALSNNHRICPLLYRLLYCCGLRVSEAVNLKVADVDLETGTLFIRASKFNKDRLVPMSEALGKMFIAYSGKFNGQAKAEDRFFRNKKGTPLSRDRIYKIFRELLWKTGISHGGRGKGPRLHDLRHGFCVHTIAKQVNDGLDLYCALPVLSAYLGHASVLATQHYVRLTAEAFPELIKKVSNTCAYVFPEVGLR
jgi:integrase